MKFSAVLLAGGKSQRMGCDKANILINGVTLWKRQLKILTDLSPSEVFISGDVRSDWIESGVTVIPDIHPNIGPLSGIMSSLQYCSHPFLVVLAVDMPRMTSKLLRSLLSLSTGNKGVVPKLGNAFEPLAAVYPKECIKIAEHCVREGHYALQEFATGSISSGLLREQKISPEEERLFLNTNTPEDLENFYKDR